MWRCWLQAMVKSMWIHNCVNQEVLGEIRILERYLSEALGSIRREMADKRENEGGGDVSTSGDGGVSSPSPHCESAVEQRTPSPSAEGRRAEKRRAKRLEDLFRYCDSLQAMLEERMKRMTLMSSEEFTNLMQLCAKLQRTAARKVRVCVYAWGVAGDVARAGRALLRCCCGDGRA